jgi:hypothetical protein
MVHSYRTNQRMRYGTNSTRLRHNNGGSSSSDTTYNSQESLRALAKRYGINQKTVAKWKKRSSVADHPTGPKEPRSTELFHDVVQLVFELEHGAMRAPLLAIETRSIYEGI